MTDNHDTRIERTAEEARGGRIILRRRASRIVFVSALVGIVIVALAVRFA